MSKPNGGPAFPLTEEDNGNPMTIYWGMTLRDYFAAQMIASLTADFIAGRLKEQSEGKCKPAEVIAEAAYGFADAMLAERVK